MMRISKDGSGTIRWLLAISGALSFVVALGTGSLLAQAAPPAPSTFQEKIEQAARALATEPRLKGMSAKQRESLVEFVVGNMLFVATHELGHGVLFEFKLPNPGRDEDAADSFAIITMLKIGTAFSQRVLIESARGYYFNDRRDKEQGEKLAFYDEHGLNLQRAYQIVCFLVGSDPVKFKELATETKLPEERQETCRDDYRATLWSWDTLLQPHRRGAEQPKQKIDVIYGEAKGDLQVFADSFRNMRFLESLADHAADRFAWPNPIVMEMQSCGEANARWQARKLKLCYELAQEFGQLYREFGRKAARTKR